MTLPILIPPLNIYVYLEGERDVGMKIDKRVGRKYSDWPIASLGSIVETELTSTYQSSAGDEDDEIALIVLMRMMTMMVDDGTVDDPAYVR